MNKHLLALSLLMVPATLVYADLADCATCPATEDMDTCEVRAAEAPALDEQEAQIAALNQALTQVIDALLQDQELLAWYQNATQDERQAFHMLALELLDLARNTFDTYNSQYGDLFNRIKSLTGTQSDLGAIVQFKGAMMSSETSPVTDVQ